MNAQRNYLIFKSAQRNFACAFEDILRIEAAATIEITPVPGFPDYMPGTAIIDGEVLPIIDAAKRFGLEGECERRHSCFITTFTDESSSLSGEYKKCALLADSVEGSVQKNEDEILPPPDINKDSFVEYISGVFISGNETFYIISPKKTMGI
jgi:purine-binding chemotaxis protein CheW